MTGDRYLNSLVKFLENQAGPLIEGALVLKLNPVGLHYVQTRLESLSELEGLLVGAPVDYLRAYVSDLGDHRALEQLRRILRLLTSVKVVSVLPQPFRDPTPLSLLPFGRLKVLELRGCDLSTSAARGLLELRHTLEKLICHNSTAALRHVFASRIADIRGSPQWNRLSFISCACNDLVLMDESLRLLPVAETLDLSRNKFTKVDNLSKCTRLKYLDLGFNHLRTIASFGFEASRNIVKLVLRNNALITLRGIENLKSLEGLDVSYNIISSFPEIEILAGLPSMECLWLEGNPLCSTRWYREQVFSLFHYPYNLKLDDKKITRREFWKRQIIVTSRHKRPASFGFYLPAKGDSEGETTNTKKKRYSRIACIESEEQAASLCSDQESVTCEDEMQNREENVDLVEDAEIVGLLNRIECMKKERSAQWLQEFKDWMDLDPQKFTNWSNHHVNMFRDFKEYNTTNNTRERHIGESSRYVSDQGSVDESVINMFESDSSVLDMASSIAHQSIDGFNEAIPKLPPVHSDKDIHRKLDNEESNSKDTEISEKSREHQFHSFPSSFEEKCAREIGTEYCGSTDDLVQSSTSVPPRSPPHYKEDILHRRHNLVEEFLQLSAHSYSVASSDSNSSSNDEDLDDIGPFVSRDDSSLFEDVTDTQVYPSLFHSKENQSRKSLNASESMQNGIHLPNVSAEAKLLPSITQVNDYMDHLEHQEAELLDLDNRPCKRKPKKRMVSLLENHTEISFSSNVCRGGTENLAGIKSSSLESEALIKSTFNSNIPYVGANESCRICMMSSCMLEQESGFCEREVAVVLSSEDKFYVLCIDITNDGSGSSLKSMGCHKMDDVEQVSVSLGLQVVRVSIQRGITYLFTTRSTVKSIQLLELLHSYDPKTRKRYFSLQSLEKVQVQLFDKFVCGGSTCSIFQYSMVSFWHCCNVEDDLWLPRSMFVLEKHVLMCTEDLTQFGLLNGDAPSSTYFAHDTCCSVACISEMVINEESLCLTLSLKGVIFNEEDLAVPPAAITWKVKWFCKESLFKCVDLIRAIHAGLVDYASSPLAMRCI